MTHTQEDWIMDDPGEPNNIEIETTTGRLIADVFCPPMVPEYGIPDDSRPECEANARLIAACPTMYKYIEDRAKLGSLTARKLLKDIQEGEEG